MCAVVAGGLRASHEIVFEDANTIAFLAKWPPLWGTTLVCPKVHVEQVVSDLPEGEYLTVQSTVRRVGRAVQATVPCERLYVMSLGSRYGNAHVHWHLAPLPPGTPSIKQQCRSYEELLVGRLDVPRHSERQLADAIRATVQRQEAAQA